MTFPGYNAKAGNDLAQDIAGFEVAAEDTSDSFGLLANRPTAVGSGKLYYATDDQSLSLDVASGQWQLVGGPSQLAEAVNNTGTATIVGSGVTVAVTGLSIVVPACSRPVYLSAQATLAATATLASAASMAIYIAEVSNGVDTPITIGGGSVLPPGSSSFIQASVTDYPLGSTLRTRTFNLQAQNNSSVGGETLNSSLFPSWIVASAR